MNRRILRRLLLPVVTVLSLFSTHRAEARIGWTNEEFEAKYGKPYGKAPRMLGEGEGEAYLYELAVPPSERSAKIAIRIHAEFKDGKAWLVKYSGKFKDTERRELLELNKAGEEWGEMATYGGRSFFVTKKTRSRYCTWYKVGDLKAAWFMTEEAFQAMARQRKAEVKFVKDQAPDWEPSFEAAPQNPAANGEDGEAKPGTPAPSGTSRLKGL